MKEVPINTLVGKTITKYKIYEDKTEVLFYCTDGSIYKIEHEQECCESVWLEDVCGDLDDILNSPIIVASEVTNGENPLDNSSDYFTWTFYTIQTIRGFVTLRWYGESNGYDSESVNLYEV